MQFSEIDKKAIEIKQQYKVLNEEAGQKNWEAAEYIQGLMGDLGDLTKLVMAKNGYRGAEDVDEKIKHELADCLWSILVLADELNIDLESEFVRAMGKLKEKIIKLSGKQE